MANLNGKLTNRLGNFFPKYFFISSVYNSIAVKPNIWLDVGCGPGKVTSSMIASDKSNKLKNTCLIGVDVFIPDLICARKVFTHLVICDVRFLPFKTCSIDVSLATDIIEHLEKKSGYILLSELDRVTDKEIIITTPVGYNHKQHLENYNPWQVHKSGWVPFEFTAQGFNVKGLDGLALLYGERCEYKNKNRLLLPLFYIVSHLSQFIVYWFPEIAYHMLCTKKKL